MTAAAAAVDTSAQQTNPAVQMIQIHPSATPVGPISLLNNDKQIEAMSTNEGDGLSELKSMNVGVEEHDLVVDDDITFDDTDVFQPDD